MNQAVGAGVIPDDSEESAEVLAVTRVLEEEVLHATLPGEDIAADLPGELTDVQPHQLEGLEDGGDRHVILHDVVLHAGHVPRVALGVAVHRLVDGLLHRVQIPAGVLAGLAGLLVLDALVQLGRRDIPHHRHDIPLGGAHAGVLGEVDALDVHRAEARAVVVLPLHNAGAEVHEVLGERHVLDEVVRAPVGEEVIERLGDGD